MLFRSVGSLVVDEEHVGLAAVHLGVHHRVFVFLAHMPVDQLLLLFERELGFDIEPHVGEVEVVLFAFVVEDAQQAAVQGNEVDLRPAPADIKHTVFQGLSGEFALQTVGGKPDPGRGEVPAPVLVRIAVAFLRGYFVPSAVAGDGSLEGGFHAFRVPVHGKGLRFPQGFAGSIAHVEGDLLVQGEIPGELAGFAHPFGVRRCLFRADGNAAFQLCFGGIAVFGFDLVGSFAMDSGVFQGEEPVKLEVLLSPGARLDHQVRRTFAVRLILGQLSQHGLIFGQGRIADEEFYEEGLVFAGFFVLGCEGMPPPVVALVGQRSVQHKFVSCDVVMIEHVLLL